MYLLLSLQCYIFYKMLKLAQMQQRFCCVEIDHNVQIGTLVATEICTKNSCRSTNQLRVSLFFVYITTAGNKIRLTKNKKSCYHHGKIKKLESSLNILKIKIN